MKKLTSIFLVLVLMFALVACCIPRGSDQSDDNNNNGEQQDQNENGENQNQNGSTGNGDGSADQIPEKKTLKINGVDISEYTIIYAKNPDAYKYTQAKKLVTQDTEYDEQTAKNLQALIKEHFGVTVKVAKDSASTSDKEIIIGKTKRGLTGDSLKAFEAANDKDICVEEKNGKLIIAGASYGATWQAVEKFIEKCLATEGTEVNIKSGYSYKTKADLLVVACIGDSLTYGTKSTTNYTSSVDDGIRSDIVPYPVVLQRLAWKTMTVYNYGKGGRTMTENHYWDDDGNGTLDTDRAWLKTAEHTACMENAQNFDLVLVMLGTNDANYNRTIKAGYTFELGGTYETAFINGCKKIVNELKAKNSDVRIALLNCPISFRSDVEDYAQNYIRKYQAKAAQQLGLDLLDMYTFTKENTVAADYPDNLHPKDEGYTVYAQGIYTLITPIVNEMLSKE